MLKQKNLQTALPPSRRYKHDASSFIGSCFTGFQLNLSFAFISFCSRKKDPVLKAGEFPPSDSGTYIAGELVFIDPINRRGGIRLDGNPPGDRYHSGPLHYFAMLPFGMIWYNGAPAELRDIPLGTHIHGYFLLPPEGEEKTIPAIPNMEKYHVKHNHALSLEDDFSFYQKRGQNWKVVSVDEIKGKINLTPRENLPRMVSINPTPLTLIRFRKFGNRASWLI